MAAIAYKLSQLRVDVQKVDRNIALISASISYRLTRSNRDEVTELRHVALQQAQLAVEENKAVVDLEQAIRLRFNELERREQATLGNIRRRKAALEGQLRALPSSQQDSDRFMRFLNQTVEARTRAYEGFKMQVGQNEMGRTAEKERMQKEAEKESMAAGVSVEDGEKMVEEAEGLWEAEEVKLQALDEAYRQALLEATKEPELEELRARLKEKMTAILAEEDKVKEEEEGREVELRDKMIAIKKEAMEAEKDLRQWVRDREQEQRDAADELSMSRAHVEVALKAVDRAHADLEDLRRRNGVATVVELKNIELESTVLPRETLKRQFGVEDQLRKDLEEVAEEEAEVERSIMERRAKARGEVGRQLDGVARAREVAEDARRAWVEAWEVVVEKHRVMLDKRQAAGTAERDAEARAAAGAEAKRVLREQGQRSDAIEDKGEEQIRDIEEKLRARLTVVSWGKMLRL